MGRPRTRGSVHPRTCIRSGVGRIRVNGIYYLAPDTLDARKPPQRGFCCQQDAIEDGSAEAADCRSELAQTFGATPEAWLANWRLKPRTDAQYCASPDRYLIPAWGKLARCAQSR